MRTWQLNRLRDLTMLVLSTTEWASTFHLGHHARRNIERHFPTARVYRELVRMEKAGLIRRHKDSAVNNICWELIK